MVRHLPIIIFAYALSFSSVADANFKLTDSRIKVILHEADVKHGDSGLEMVLINALDHEGLSHHHLTKIVRKVHDELGHSVKVDLWHTAYAVAFLQSHLGEKIEDITLEALYQLNRLWHFVDRTRDREIGAAKAKYDSVRRNYSESLSKVLKKLHDLKNHPNRPLNDKEVRASLALLDSRLVFLDQLDYKKVQRVTKFIEIVDDLLHEVH